VCVCVCVYRTVPYRTNYFQVDSELEIKAYYAGHVLGAAMFHIRVGSQSVVYTVSLLVLSCMSLTDACF